jgi:hypothetical protein
MHGFAMCERENERVEILASSRGDGGQMVG